MTIIYFIIALGILIFIHEFGHFIMAKRAGIFVETFSLGFGPRLFGIKKGDTDYRISLIPFGGYVKMRGESPDDSKAQDPKSFMAKSVWSRFTVIVWGPLMNVVLAMVFMPIVFMLGREEPIFLREQPIVNTIKASSPAEMAGIEKGDLILSVDGKKTNDWESVLNKVLLNPGAHLKFKIDRGGEIIERDATIAEIPEIKGGFVGFEPMFAYETKAIVEGVKPSGPADKAGLKKGDEVISFGGQPVKDWIDLATKVHQSEGRPSEIVVVRDGEKISLNISAEYNKEFSRWLVGISQDRKAGIPMVVRNYGPVDAFVYGMKEIGKLTMLTLTVLKKLVTLQLSYKVLGGPIIIAKASAAAAASGLADFLYFIAFLSLQLSILNLLPVPVLDGGQVVFLGIESVLKRPLGTKLRSIADQVGFVLLISLMLLVTYNDVNRLWGISDWLKKLF